MHQLCHACCRSHLPPVLNLVSSRALLKQAERVCNYRLSEHATQNILTINNNAMAVAWQLHSAVLKRQDMAHKNNIKHANPYAMELPPQLCWVTKLTFKAKDSLIALQCTCVRTMHIPIRIILPIYHTHRGMILSSLMAFVCSWAVLHIKLEFISALIHAPRGHIVRSKPQYIPYTI